MVIKSIAWAVIAYIRNLAPLGVSGTHSRVGNLSVQDKEIAMIWMASVPRKLMVAEVVELRTGGTKYRWLGDTTVFLEGVLSCSSKHLFFFPHIIISSFSKPLNWEKAHKTTGHNLEAPRSFLLVPISLHGLPLLEAFRMWPAASHSDALTRQQQQRLKGTV